jgi:hypothetical protein
MMIKRVFKNSIVLFATFIILLQIFPAVSGGALEQSIKAPEFTQADANVWLNSPPLTLNDLKGKVVLEDQGLQIIGVHTPEYEREKIKENIISKVDEFKLHHPIMIDNDFAYWNAMGNRYWPAYYIVDKNSHVRAVFYGETHENDEQAKKIEEVIMTLLQET